MKLSDMLTTPAPQMAMPSALPQDPVIPSQRAIGSQIDVAPITV
jgi:hypothetical protein